MEKTGRLALGGAALVLLAAWRPARLLVRGSETTATCGGAPARARNASDGRFATPDAASVEAQLGPLPQAVLFLYCDLDTVSRRSIRAMGPDGRSWPIAAFVPLDGPGLASHREGLGPRDLPIARGPRGETYFAPLAEATLDDAPLHVVQGAGGALRRVAASLADFHSRTRVALERSAIRHVLQ